MLHVDLSSLCVVCFCGIILMMDGVGDCTGKMLKTPQLAEVYCVARSFNSSIYIFSSSSSQATVDS